MSKIVTATGTASGAVRRNQATGRSIEQAMTDAVIEIQLESEAILAQTDITDEEKQKRVAALNAPENVLKRKLEARAAEKERMRE